MTIHIYFTNNFGYLDCYSSKMYFTGTIVFTNNTVGTIAAVLCDIYFNSTEEISITNNTALIGGGLCVGESTLSILSPIKISENTVEEFGGAINYIHT